MRSIRGILQNKKPLISVRADQTVFDAVEAMVSIDVGAVLVLDDAGNVAGIFTERDCMQKVSRPGLDLRATPIRDVMTTKVRYVTPDQTVEQCLSLMTERFFRHLPVLDENKKVLGIISIGDLVKAKLADQEFIIDQMEHYITDSLPLAR